MTAFKRTAEMVPLLAFVGCLVFHSSGVSRRGPSPFTVGHSGSTVGVGTILSLQINSTATSFRFDATTRATLSLTYHAPGGGSPTDTVHIVLDAADVLESSTTAATVIAGTGTWSGLKVESVLENPGGTLQGTMTLRNKNGTSATAAVEVALGAGQAELRPIVYLSGVDDSVAPTLALQSIDISIVSLSQLGAGTPPPQASLRSLGTLHRGIILEMAENLAASTVVPAAVQVDLVTVSASGQVLDHVKNISLGRASDSAAGRVRYMSTLSEPLVFVDTALDRSTYTNVVPVRADHGGKCIVVPAITD